MVLAAAAALAVLSPVVLDRSPGDPVLRSSADGGIGDAVAPIVTVQPEDGRTISGSDVVFIWRAEAPNAFYRLTVTDAAGDILWRSSTSDTVVTLSPAVTVDPGYEYFWIVDALLEHGTSSTTGMQSFVMAPLP